MNLLEMHLLLMFCICLYLQFSFAVSLLKDLKHANIVTLHDIVHTDKSLTLVFEYLVSAYTVSELCIQFIVSK